MKYKRILLIVPNCNWISGDSRTIWGYMPYGLSMIAGSLRDRYEVSVLDANFYNLDMEAFLQKVADFNPDVTGISILTDEYAAAGHLAAKRIKEFNKEILVVAGGVYPTTRFEELNDGNIDYIFAGEGDLAFREMLDILNGDASAPKLSVWSENRHGMAVVKAQAIDKLDGLPLPAYDLVTYEDYANNFIRESVDGPADYPYGSIITSRGCPIGCVFCQVEMISGKKFRARSPENVAKEIELLIERYGIKSLLFYDDNLFLNKKRALAIFNLMIERNFNLKWKASATAEYAVDREVLETARRSGLQHVGLAIESGTERVLREIIRKTVNLSHAKEVVTMCRDLGIASTANFVIGFPGETWDEIRKTLQFAEEINVDYVKIFIANPLPRTKLYDLARDGGYLLSEKSEGWWALGRIRTEEFTEVELTILRAYEWDRINFKTEEKKAVIAGLMGVSMERIDEIRKDTFVKTTDALKRHLMSDGCPK